MGHVRTWKEGETSVDLPLSVTNCRWNCVWRITVVATVVVAVVATVGRGVRGVGALEGPSLLCLRDG